VPSISFHVEHIIPKQHGDTDDPANLCLACPECNLSKGPNLTAIDGETGDIVPLFHPRNDAWPDHFFFRGVEVVGITPTGRATVELLKMNVPRRLELRRESPAQAFQKVKDLLQDARQ